VGAETSNLENEDAIIIEQVVDGFEVSLVTTDTDVLGHFQADDFGEGTLLPGDVAIVHAQNTSTTGVASVVLNPVIAEFRLIFGESNTGCVTVVVLGRKKR